MEILVLNIAEDLKNAHVCVCKIRLSSFNYLHNLKKHEKCLDWICANRKNEAERERERRLWYIIRCDGGHRVGHYFIIRFQHAYMLPWLLGEFDL